jgi:hypothetical protein
MQDLIPRRKNSDKHGQKPLRPDQEPPPSESEGEPKAPQAPIPRSPDDVLTSEAEKPEKKLDNEDPPQ